MSLNTPQPAEILALVVAELVGAIPLALAVTVSARKAETCSEIGSSNTAPWHATHRIVHSTIVHNKNKKSSAWENNRVYCTKTKSTFSNFRVKINRK